MEQCGVLGKNAYGTLGCGTNEDSLIVTEVKIDENTPLTNVIKISVGTNHALALTEDGYVYAWGANNFGQIGQTDKQNSNYAKKVVGEGGSDFLNRIVDISAGSYGSTAINEFGWSYVWGNGSYGETGNGKNVTTYSPVRNSINKGISEAIGAGHVAMLEQSGKLYTWGRNTYGELGLGNTSNYTLTTKVSEGITEVTASGFGTLVRSVNGKLYGTGLNTSRRTWNWN